ncbi:MAG: esterase family protein [Firmicutes bacterium]|nr:esterase family protein [Bacillota bacterium]
MEPKRLLLVFIFLLCLFQINAFAEENRLITVQIPAPSLQNNLVGEALNQLLVIALPPSYYSSDQCYPVVYFLHGFGESPHNVGLFARLADSLYEENQLNEMIIVGVNGTNRLGGSFYVNSPVTGNWEDFVVNDVIGYLDQNYRTLPQSSSRGIAGFSMGGFAAINLAFRHPGVFSVVYSLAPGLFDENGLPQAMTTWDQRFRNAYGAAFSPNPNLPYPHSEIPVLDNSADDNRIKANWENGFGNLEQKIADYLCRGITLKSIRIEVGERDYYKWIINGCLYFSQLLTEQGIPHELNRFSGGHTLTSSLIEKNILPYFSQQLERMNSITNN